jgi:hypothetical protein
MKIEGNNQAHSARTKAPCPKCDGERNCIEYGTVTKKWAYNDDFHGFEISGGTNHSLLECMGCETVFYHEARWNSEDWQPDLDEHFKEVVTYPRPASKTKPVWLKKLRDKDAALHNILSQMYVAIDNQSNILAAIGLRTALDRATEYLKIDPAETFENKLNQMLTGGFIGETERDILAVVTDAGSAAAHRGWEPDNDEILQLVMALEVFLHRAFIVGKDALGIKGKLPLRPRKRKASKSRAIES